MNLVDIVRRKDRALTAVSPGVAPGVRVCAGRKMQTIELPAGGSLRLSRILDFRGLQSFPTDLDWKWNDDPKIAVEMQKQHGEKFVHDWKVQSLQSCSACHR